MQAARSAPIRRTGSGRRPEQATEIVSRIVAGPVPVPVQRGGRNGQVAEEAQPFGVIRLDVEHQQLLRRNRRYDGIVVRLPVLGELPGEHIQTGGPVPVLQVPPAASAACPASHAQQPRRLIARVENELRSGIVAQEFPKALEAFEVVVRIVELHVREGSVALVVAIQDPPSRFKIVPHSAREIPFVPVDRRYSIAIEEIPERGGAALAEADLKVLLPLDHSSPPSALTVGIPGERRLPRAGDDGRFRGVAPSRRGAMTPR